MYRQVYTQVFLFSMLCFTGSYFKKGCKKERLEKSYENLFSYDNHCNILISGESLFILQMVCMHKLIKMKDMLLETYVKSAFQPSIPRKVPETFLMVWEDLDSDDLAIEDAYAFDKIQLY